MRGAISSSVAFWRGKQVLVTGGGSGIGLAVSQRLAASGAHVFIAGRRADVLQRAVATLSLEAPREDDSRLLLDHHFMACDVTDAEQRVGLVSAANAAAATRQRSSSAATLTTSKHRDCVDVVVHCAGATLNKLAVRTTASDLERLFAVNVVAAVEISRLVTKQTLKVLALNKPASTIAEGEPSLVVPDLADSARFVHVAIGSVVGESGNAGQVAYAASKGALSAAFRSLAKEYGRKGIRFNVVAPGLVGDTAMSDAMHPADTERWLGQSALGRLGHTADVAAAVALSCECGWLNGQVVRLDGG